MTKKTENATKFAQAIEKMRAAGLTVTDKTRKGSMIGITGVHKPRERVHDLEKEKENTTKLSQAIARLRALGLSVTDETHKGGGIGFIGGGHKESKETVH